ncbi:MAG: HypC/HybG/HupF family hydrogenase formation chaperone [Actinobacteria bacterium]|nr:HypC/HybG/HupF family hydrogenase formation chaperone [Actinomycetota bacterium]
MRVLRVDAARGLALCAGEDGARSTVEIALVEPVAPGDALLVHAGVALVRLEPAEVGA